MNPLLMVWNLKEVAVKPFAHFYKEILMVLEASGSCCESIIDGSESRGGCCEAICALLLLMVLEASGGCVNPLLMVWNLQEVAVKPFTYFYILLY